MANRLYVTGDTHGDIDIRKIYQWVKATPDLSYEDILFIAGDWGGLWYSNKTRNQKEVLDFFQKLPCTIAVIPGNHENYNLIESYPVDYWKGVEAVARKICDNIYIIKHGEVLDIDGTIIWCFGGAESIDRNNRIAYVSWWPQEVPTSNDMFNGESNFGIYQYVDYVITHTCPKKCLTTLFGCGVYNNGTQYIVEKYLDYISENFKFTKWFHGHHHLDKDYRLDRNDYISLYERVIQIR